MPASIKAEVQSVVYHNPDNGYAVARVRAKDEPGVITIVGCLGQLQPGEFLEIEGEWKTHPKFGRQMEVASFKQTYPATANGVVRFLKSSLKGVGEKTAEALVQEFGVAVLDILDTDPDRLRKVKGVTKKRLEGMASLRSTLTLRTFTAASSVARMTWLLSCLKNSKCSLRAPSAGS